jgi:UDP-N-acetylglucosamine transferase subunit ALG13
VTAVNGHQPVAAEVQVLVTVGTDHHPFDRLIHWVNDWLGTHPQHIPGFFLQSGSTAVAPVCAGARSVDVQRLDQLLDGADVIVCHGGPASIAAAWARDLLPIVVPRRPELGEHVDDHQVIFSRKVAELGRIRLVQTQAEFGHVLTEVIRDPSRLRRTVPVGDVSAAVGRFAELVDRLVGQPRHRPRSRRPLPRGLVPAPTVTPENSTSAAAGSERSRENPRDLEAGIGIRTDPGDQLRRLGGTPSSVDGSPATRSRPLSTADEEQGWE